MQPWFMWHFSYAFVYLLGAMMSISFLRSNKKTLSWSNGTKRCFVVLVIGMLWLAFRAPVMVLAGNIFFLISIYVFLGTSRELKHELFLFIKKKFATLLAVSLFFYFIYLIGIPLPHIYSDYGLYGTDNYFFFVLTHDDMGGFNRFRSIFGEPGYMTLGLIPLFFAGKFYLKDKYNIILLLAELVSFSLAGYVILVLVTIFYSISHTGYKKYARGFIVFLTLFITLFVVQNKEFFEIIDTNILERVTVDDSTGNIAGYNRSTEYMDAKFEQFRKTPDIIWGIGDNAMNEMREKTGMDEGGGNAGIKIYTYIYGIIGVFVFVLFYFLCYYKYRTRDSFVYFLCLMLLLFQNSYVDWYCVTIGSILCFNELSRKISTQLVLG